MDYMMLEPLTENDFILFDRIEIIKKTMQFIKEEAVERMKELTYITNFIDE